MCLSKRKPRCASESLALQWRPHLPVAVRLNYIPRMVKPQKFTPHTWRDQQRLLAEGARSQAAWGGLKGAAILLGLGVGVLAWLALLVYVIADLFF